MHRLGKIPPHAADSACYRTGSFLLGVRWFPVPAGGDRAGGALVSALRDVLPGRGGAAGRARHRRLPRHRVGDRWHVDETYVKVAGRWVYLYRAVDQYGQVIDVYASTRRDTEAAHRFFDRARTTTGVLPTEVVTDRAATYPHVLDQVVPAAWHHVERYANNRVEADHAQLERRLRPMRGIKTMTGASGTRDGPRLRAEPAPRT